MGARENYRFIIDCLMNLPLLYWASEQSGDEKYRTIALKHTQTCLAKELEANKIFKIRFQTVHPFGNACNP